MVERVAASYDGPVGVTDDNDLVFAKPFAEIVDQLVQVLLRLFERRRFVVRVNVLVSELGPPTAALVPVDERIGICELLLEHIGGVCVWSGRLPMEPNDNGVAHILPTNKEVLLLASERHICRFVDSLWSSNVVLVVRVGAGHRDDKNQSNDQHQAKQPCQLGQTPPG